MINFIIKGKTHNSIYDILEELQKLEISDYRYFAISKEDESKECNDFMIYRSINELLKNNINIKDDDICFFIDDGEHIILNQEIINKVIQYSAVSDVVCIKYASNKEQDEIFNSSNAESVVFNTTVFPVFTYNLLKDKQEFLNGGCTIREMRTIITDLARQENNYIPVVNVKDKTVTSNMNYEDVTLYLEKFDSICNDWILAIKNSSCFSSYEQIYLLRMIVRRFHANKNKNTQCVELIDVVERKKFFKIVGELLKNVTDEIIYSFLHDSYDPISKQELSVLYSIKRGSLSPIAKFQLIMLPSSVMLTVENRIVGTIDQEVIQIDGAYWNDELNCFEIMASTNGVYEDLGGYVSAELSGKNILAEVSDGINITYFKKKTSTRKKYCFRIYLEELGKDFKISFYMNLSGKKYGLRCLMKYYDTNSLMASSKANILEIKYNSIVKIVQYEDDILELEKTLNSLIDQGEIEGTKVVITQDCSSKEDVEQFVMSYNHNNNIDVTITDVETLYSILSNHVYGYITFIQSGDIICDNYLQKTISFMEKMSLNIAVPNEIVQEKKSLDNKEQIIDISKKLIILEDAGVVYSRELFLKLDKEWFKHFMSIKYKRESRLAILYCLLKYEKIIGIMSNSVYCSGYLSEKDGALFTTKTEYDYYIPSAENFMYKICEFYDYNLPYIIQCNLFYVLNWRFAFNENQKQTHAIPDDKIEQWYEVSHNILKSISDEIITGFYSIKPAKVKPHVKLWYLWLKDSERYNCKLLQNNNCVSFISNNYEIVTTKNERVNIELINYENDKFIIDMTTRGFFEVLGLTPRAEYNGNPIDVEEMYYFAHRKFFGKSFWKRYTFRVVLNIPKGENGLLTFYYEYKGQRYDIRLSSSHYTARISSNVPGSYWKCGDYLVSYAKNQTGIVFEPYTDEKQKKMEANLEKLCLAGTSSKLKEFAKRGIEIRREYFKTKEQYADKHIWLTYDKLYKGGDCGEYMYKFLADNIEGIDARYVVNEDAPDYERLIEEGYPVLKYGSEEHLLDYLNSEVVFNTHGGIHAFNGFDPNLVQFVADLIHHDAFTIQHGLTVQELAFNAHRRFNNIRGYFCASKYEIQNLSRPIYGYEDKSILKLTGIPRYDGLISDDKRQILITPTWRNYIAMPATAKNEQKGYYEGFKKTDYFKIYNRLLSDDKLIETARKTGYKLIYLLHPVVSAQISDYETRDGVEIIQASTVNYEKILKESSLMVTDYSGVQFDFAYMRKPLVYYHNPQIPPHYKESGFIYEKMAFGEICTNHDEIVNVLCDYMENNCKLKDFYRERQDDFFAYSDNNSCQRIYNIVKEYEDKKVNNF